MYGMNTRGLPGTLAPIYQELQVERSEPPATSRTCATQFSAASFDGLPARFGGAIGVADSAGGDDGMGDLCVGGSLPPALFRGRHVRQEIELALAVDQDRDQRLAVLGEQDAFSPFLGAQPDPEREADRPIARDDAAVVIDHEDRTIGRRR